MKEGIIIGIIGLILMTYKKKDIIMIIIGLEIIIIGGIYIIIGEEIGEIRTIYTLILITIGGSEAGIGLGIILKLNKEIGSIEEKE